jgi:hypothetical protein
MIHAEYFLVFNRAIIDDGRDSRVPGKQPMAPKSTALPSYFLFFISVSVPCWAPPPDSTDCDGAYFIHF